MLYFDLNQKLKMMRSTICFLFLLVCASVNAQTTVITTGPIKLGIQVYDYDNDRFLDISKLSKGFDQEGLPIDLVIPYQSQIKLFLPGIDESTDRDIRYRSERVRIKKVDNFGFNYQGRNVPLLLNSSYSEGAQDAIEIIELENIISIMNANPTVNLTWRVDYGSVDLEVFIQNDEIDERQAYSDTIMSNLFSSNEVEKNYDYWLTNGLAQSLNADGLPENPVIPRGFGIISFASNAPDVSLYRDGEKISFDRFESRPYGASSVYYFKPDQSGSYIVRMADPRKVYGETTRSYAFSVPFNFWQEGGYYMIGGIGLFGIFFLVYRVNAKRKLESAELYSQISQAELKAIRSQLNPHFLFNALNAIQNLVNQKDNEQANNYIVKLSRLMRQVLAESNEAYHTLEDELSVSKNYIELEQLRKPFQFELDIDDSIDMNSLMPNMLLQPYLENAVIHGVNNNGANQVSLKIQEKNHALLFKISNDGKQTQSSIQEGQGMKLGKQRLEIINKQYGNGSATLTTHVGIEQFTVEIKLPKDL